MDVKKYSRIAFMIFSMIISVSGLVCFIFGNFNFEKQFVITYGFLGGHFVSIAPFIIVYGILGFYAGYKQDKVALMTFTVIAVLSFLSRVILWIETSSRGLTVASWWYYGGSAFEIITIICGISFFFFIN